MAAWVSLQQHFSGRDKPEEKTDDTNTNVSPEMTRSAQRYLEQYGDPLVMNTYLKVTILVLAVVCFTLAALVFESQRALANCTP